MNWQLGGNTVMKAKELIIQKDEVVVSLEGGGCG